MAKYEIRKYEYNNYTDKKEYVGGCINFNTFEEIKNYILHNSDSGIVCFGDVFKNGEMIFGASTLLAYIDDMKLYRECQIKVKPLSLKNLIAYYEDDFAIRA